MSESTFAASPAKTLLSKSIFTPLGCSLTALSVTVLAQALCATGYGKKLPVFASFGYTFGEDAGAVVSVITGIVISFAILMLAVSFFVAHAAAKADNIKASSLSLLKFASVVSVMLTSVIIVIAFASVGVLNYQQLLSANNAGRLVQPVDSGANSLFDATVFLGASAILSEIGLIRFAGSLESGISENINKKSGSIMLGVASIVGAVTSVTMFFAALYKLVTPSAALRQSVMNDLMFQKPDVSDLLLSTLGVILFTSLSVVFITASIASFSFAAAVDTVNRAGRSTFYGNMYGAAGAQNNPDYTVPGNYNYYQPKAFTPYADMNNQYRDIYKNIYTGEIPPVPKAPKNPFKPDGPKTQYPSASKGTADIKEAATPEDNDNNAADNNTKE